ncbi:MAG: MBL fold metallo-hydrolase [Spartobacteria bacterium]|nr:MBL fold metallo-hydrolase [Spartobacteria bacterium]
MKLIFGGVRGTTPVADAAFLQYGGSTTSFMIEGDEGDALLVDLGTGIRTLIPALQALREKDLLILMTHYHQDHLIGFAGLPFIYDPDWHIHVRGPNPEGLTLDQVFNGMMARPFWPLQIDTLQARIDFSACELAANSVPLVRGGLAVRWCPVHHEGGCLAYRIEERASARSVIIATDIEWALSSKRERDDFLRFCSTPCPADALVFDGHFTPQNYDRFKGWGHSTWRDGESICKQTGIGRLYMTHHAQGNDDAFLAHVEQEMHAAFPGALMARQGMVVDMEAVNHD